MSRAFEIGGADDLQAILTQHPLLAFDFDGTLAPITARPEDAAIPAALVQCLSQLACWFPLAIISGRSITDLMPRLGFVPRYVVGQHGAEISGALQSTHATSLALSQLRERIAQETTELLQAGVSIEDKQLSLALHYRNAPDQQAAQACIADVLHDLPEGLQQFGGKCVVNIVVASNPDKGAALKQLIRHCEREALIFIGDDENDEPAFIAGASENNWLTIRVGDMDGRSQARFHIEHQEQVQPLLLSMLAYAETGTLRR